MERDRIIIRTSIIGILTNVLLAAFKAVVGLLSNSIAIVLDAVNNLSDALSSFITIIGTKLANRKPDKDHPYGYGRIEYLSATIISVIVLYAGITSLVESVKKILHPETPDYSTAALIIVTAAVVVKLVLGRYVKKKGEEVDSGSLVNSGEDAMNDSLISLSTLVAAGVYLLTKISLEAYLGVIISLVILKSGIEMLKETINRILGERTESELSLKIKQSVCKTEGVRGAYDLILHDYGPDRKLASVHVEVPDTFTAEKIDEITREIETRIFEEFHIYMTTVGVYSYNTRDDEAAKIRDSVRDLIMEHEHVLQMHGFYIDTEKKTMRFDVVIDFMEKDIRHLYETICTEVQNHFPDYSVQIALDTDISD